MLYPHDVERLARCGSPLESATLGALALVFGHRLDEAKVVLENRQRPLRCGVNCSAAKSAEYRTSLPRVKPAAAAALVSAVSIGADRCE
jgi:multidrug efflux pump subunit AcrB